MTIKAKATKNVIDQVIEKGGKTKEDAKIERDVVKFTMILPLRLDELIDKNRSDRIVPITRRGWILEAIMEKLERGNK